MEAFVTAVEPPYFFNHFFRFVIDMSKKISTFVAESKTNVERR